MRLDPQIAAMLPDLDAGFPRVEMMTAAQARDAIRARRPNPDEPESVAEVAERVLPDGLRTRIYWPIRQAGSTSSRTSGDPPLIVFAHGGGFVFCDLDTHDGFCRAMANGVGAIVVSVDYRLSPEHSWPTPAHDVHAAIEWSARSAAQLGADPDRLVVAGDSAGGNLVAVAALMARDGGGADIAGQVLLYPVIAADPTTESYRRFGNGYYNTRAAMNWYWDQYVPVVADRLHPYASPIRAQLSGLPSALIVTAGCDPLCSEGADYVGALRTAGVPTMHRHYGGAIHGFMTMPVLALAQRAQRRLWTDISELLP